MQIVTSAVARYIDTNLHSGSKTDLPARHQKPHAAASGAGRLAAAERAFKAVGGVLSGDVVSVLLQVRSDQPISMLARWIVDRKILSFEEHGQRWIPMFQFSGDDLAMTRAVQIIIGELRDVFDDWDLVEWFASPNAALGGERPSDIAARDENGAIDAARLDRFVAAG